MIHAIGVIEIKSIAKGMEACDNALKSANVRMITAHSVCPGKYEMLLTGEISAVQAAIDQVKYRYGHYVIDSVMLGRIEESVIRALMGAQDQPKPGPVGIIETFTAASAIKAADTAVKTAEVEICDLRIARGMGGKGVVVITGGIGAVTAAVEAGSDYAKQQGLFAASSVMAAPHEELFKYI
jgi:microcompartment protein CcmL/EutN